MRYAIVLICLSLLGSVTSAEAGYFFTRNGTVYYAGNAADARPRPPAATSHVFFTRVSGYRQSGFECIPLTEVSFVNGRQVKSTGTICRDNGI